MSVATVAAETAARVGRRQEPPGALLDRRVPPAPCRPGTPPREGPPSGRSSPGRSPGAWPSGSRATGTEVEVVGDADDPASDIDLAVGPGVVEPGRVVEEDDRVLAPAPGGRLAVEDRDRLDKGDRPAAGGDRLGRGSGRAIRAAVSGPPIEERTWSAVDLLAGVEDQGRGPAVPGHDPADPALHAALAAGLPGTCPGARRRIERIPSKGRAKPLEQDRLEEERRTGRSPCRRSCGAAVHEDRAEQHVLEEGIGDVPPHDLPGGDRGRVRGVDACPGRAAPAAGSRRSAPGRRGRPRPRRPRNRS